MHELQLDERLCPWVARHSRRENQQEADERVMSREVWRPNQYSSVVAMSKKQRGAISWQHAKLGPYYEMHDDDFPVSVP